MSETVMMGQPGGPLAWVVVISSTDDGQVFRLTNNNNIGRDGTCQVRLNDTHVSLRHACIRFENGRFVLHDLASTNRTYLNGNTLGAPQSLEDGDRIRVGGCEMVFKRAR